MRAALPALLVALALAAAALQANATLYKGYETLITIDTHGVAHVQLAVNVSKGLGSIVLPVKPVVATMIVEEGGRILTPIYLPDNNTLFFVAPEPGIVTIRYVANVTTEGGVVSFDVGPVEAKLVLAPDIVLLSIPGRVLETSYDNSGRLYVVFQGPARVEYTVKTGGAAQPATTTPPATATATQPQQPTTSTPAARTPAPTATPTTGARSQGQLLTYAAVAAGVVLVAAGVFFALRSRGGATRPSPPSSPPAATSPGPVSPPPGQQLSDVDRAILEKLAEKGGSALQSELQKELGIPKSTLSRRLRRLAEAGYVEIERLGGVNRVKLRKKE